MRRIIEIVARIDKKELAFLTTIFGILTGMAVSVLLLSMTRNADELRKALEFACLPGSTASKVTLSYLSSNARITCADGRLTYQRLTILNRNNANISNNGH